MSEQNEIERRRDEIMARLTTERDAAREHAQTYAEENRALRDNLRGAVSDEAAQRFRDALAPGYILWHDGKRLSPEDTLTQIKRGLIAAIERR